MADNAPIRVAICGIRGRMGQEMRVGLSADPALEVVGGCDPRPPIDGAPPADLPETASLADLFKLVQADAVVDFTTAEGARENAAVALERGIPIVIGTTGLTPDDFDRLDEQAKKGGTAALVAPNFAIGAVLLMQLSKMASTFFDSAEIIETHHDGKIDSPSGTALMIANAMREAKGRAFAGDNVSKHTVEGTRGGVAGDLHIHSMRLPGFVATHQVIFGGPGQSLTIRHDSIGRDSFVPGVIFALKNIRGRVGLVYGLDQLMTL